MTRITVPWMLVVVLGLTAFPSMSRAQIQNQAPVQKGSVQTFEALPAVLMLGTDVTVVKTNGQTHKGMLTGLSPGSLLLVNEEGKTQIEASDVQQVLRDERASTRRGAAYGLIAGSGAGLAGAALQCKYASYACSGTTWVAGPIFWGGVGAGIGALVAKGMRKTSVAYERSPASASVTVAPILSSRARGVAVAISWQSGPARGRRQLPPLFAAIQPRTGLAASQSPREPAADAQTPAPFATLSDAVKLGDEVRIVEAGGEERKARIADISPSILTVIVDGQRKEYAGSTVDRILKDEDDPLSNGAWVGFGVGAGIGAITGIGFAAGGYGNAAGALAMSAIMGGMSAAIGAGLDALVKDTREVYRRPRGTRLELAPVVSPRGSGARVVLRW